MIAGIVGVPKRLDLIERLAALIEPQVDHLQVFLDHDYQGNWWNTVRTWRDLTRRAKPNEPVLVMTDDVTTVPDWRSRWERIHSQAQNDIYSLFTRQRFLFTAANLDRGYVTKVQRRGFYDQAVILINQSTLIDDVLDWFNGPGRTAPGVVGRERHLDVVIQEFLINKNKPWTITVPTLFNHLPVRSTLGHTVGESPYFVGGTGSQLERQSS